MSNADFGGSSRVGHVLLTIVSSSPAESPMREGAEESTQFRTNAAMSSCLSPLTFRAATGVVVKNGWANRNGVTFPPRGLPAFDETAFLAI